VNIQKKMKTLNQAIDAWQREYKEQGGRLFCGRGCSNCCTLYVRITGVEALHIAGQLTPEQSGKLKLHVDKMKLHAGGSASMTDFLHRARFKVGPCPFLDPDGACGIYQCRPFACRGMLSTRPAEWCGADFSLLHPLEKEAYRSGLDREVVAWPTHYVEATQYMAEAQEGDVVAWMTESWGFRLVGSLGYLVWLVRESEAMSDLSDMAGAAEFFAEKGREFPYLLTLDRGC